MPSPSPPDWQCVLIAWGERYPISDINQLVRSIRAEARGLKRVILLSDRPRADLEPEVEVREIPAWYLAPEFRGGGCHTKLCLFEPGVVPDDRVAVYVDLDTLVLGDLSRVLDGMATPGTIGLLPASVLPFGALSRQLCRVTGGRTAARGNSSVVVFHPAQAAFIATRFRKLVDEGADIHKGPLRADDRFISWVAQDRVRLVSNRLVVKFPAEFMQPWRWLVHLRASLPWVRRRRDGLVAVTFPGVNFKGADLARLPDGAEITDRRGRRLFWTDRAMGGLRGLIRRHYATEAVAEGKQVNP
jgi:hypothetical protein